ncbi:MAG: hypothetical protein GY860_16700, partial [Desulfobacteraceae bacterium]|nr:hypothetical protein [Desulfobacteraceae bacterium]
MLKSNRKTGYSCTRIFIGVLILMGQAWPVMAMVDRFSPMEMIKATGFMEQFFGQLSGDQAFQNDLREKKDLDSFLNDLERVKGTLNYMGDSLEKVNAMIMADDMDMMALNSAATKISKIAGYVESNFRSLFREYFDKIFEEQYEPRYHQIMEHFDKVDGLLSHKTFFERIEDRIDVDITRRKPSIVEFGFELRCLMG